MMRDRKIESYKTETTEVWRFVEPGWLCRLGCLLGLHPVPPLRGGTGFHVVECACGRTWLYRRGMESGLGLQPPLKRLKMRLPDGVVGDKVVERASENVRGTVYIAGADVGDACCRSRRKDAGRFLKRLGYTVTDDLQSSGAVYILDGCGRCGDNTRAVVNLAREQGKTVLKERDRVDLTRRGGRTYLDNPDWERPLDVTGVTVGCGYSDGKLPADIRAMIERYLLNHPGCLE